MHSDFFDNKSRILKDDLVKTMSAHGKVAIAAQAFSVYAYQELKAQLEALDEFRFLFTAQTFTGTPAAKEAREFYIPRLARERQLFGTQYEVRLRNELTQKAIALECARWIRRKATFKSFAQENSMGLATLIASSSTDTVAYLPFQAFTTGELGTKHAANSFNLINRLDTNTSNANLTHFNSLWQDPSLIDVTAQVIDSIQAMYQENAPELIYYLTLYHVFQNHLTTVSEDVLPVSGLRLKESKIWNMLYDFQKDAVLAIINKLETYRGCILADSVGLGKTFTALAVIKYYESRNKDVLVLAPKRLRDNWLTFNQHVVNNPIAEDRLAYNVLYHTDLLRERGMSETGIPLDRINWSNYGLVVIDESHNFRNGADSAVKTEQNQNRYQKLMEKVIKDGPETRVLMLSATPVNNRFRDLRNQLALAYEGNHQNWSETLNIDTDIETVFKNAQRTFTAWSKLPSDERTTEALTNMLDFDFFEVLDQVTVARSRKHIQRYYDMAAIGPFPARNKPISRRPALTHLQDAVNYQDIYQQLLKLTLAAYLPSFYVHPSKVSKYPNKHGNLTSRGREMGLYKLMRTNLLKRLESSVNSFKLTLERMHQKMQGLLDQLDAFKASGNRAAGSGFTVSDATPQEGYDFDPDDAEELDAAGGRPMRFSFADMDWQSWERNISADKNTIEFLLSLIEDITPDHDAKLQQLLSDIEAKVKDPLNPHNKKVMVFTAFADTANYLYEHVSRYAKDQLGLDTAVLTGTGGGRSTIAKLPADMGNILACFSPDSKDRDAILPAYKDCNIDILIATDCISEGQNLQDCDFLINYDIHWNPVRIVQRFGRIDRIGSKNNCIQLVNYWPDVELDEYIKLKARVEDRMRITVMTSTGDDDYINEDEKGDLEYREKQLRHMQEEVIDLEDVSGGISITDLGLSDFHMDLVGYYKENPDIQKLPRGIHAVAQGSEPGIIFVLKNVNQEVNVAGKNQLHPFYLVHVSADGTAVHGHLHPKDVLDQMRLLCKGKAEPDQALCRAFNKETKDGKDMHAASALLEAAIASIIEVKTETDLESFFTGGTTSFLEDDISGLDDFELICFLVVRPC